VTLRPFENATAETLSDVGEKEERKEESEKKVEEEKEEDCMNESGLTFELVKFHMFLLSLSRALSHSLSP